MLSVSERKVNIWLICNHLALALEPVIETLVRGNEGGLSLMDYDI